MFPVLYLCIHMYVSYLNLMTIAKVGAGLGLGLRFSHLSGIIKLSEILRSSGNCT